MTSCPVPSKRPSTPRSRPVHRSPRSSVPSTSPKAALNFSRERHHEHDLRYEIANEDEHHDHLICVECGAITEFEEPAIERLQEEIAARYSFSVRSHKHELYGVCAACTLRAKQG